jgi:hypothetical protein
MKRNRTLFGVDPEVADSPFRSLDEFTYEELLKVDPETQTERARISNTFAALNALAGITGMPADVRLAYEALIDAARGADKRESKTRRFISSAWQVECHRTRDFIPPDLPEDEKKRIKASKSRNWRRYGWMPIHKFQRENHLSFFDKEIYQRGEGREKRPVAVFHDRLTDLLFQINKRALSFRGTRVDKFNRAAQACLEEFRRSAPAYAAHWSPEDETEETRPETKKKGTQAESREPAEIRTFRRAIQKIKKATRVQLPEDIAAARNVLLAIIDEEWPAESAKDSLPPVLNTYADVANFEPAKSESSCPRTFEQDCNFAEENAKKEPDHADVFRLVVEPDGAEALRALEAFESVNADTFEVTLLDETKPKGAPAALFEVVDPISLKKNLPRYLKRNETRPESLIIRVRSEFHLLQLDDCNAEVMRQLAPYCFLQEWTSPYNGQCWMAIADEIDQETFKTQRKRHLDKLKPTGANLGPSGSTRWPGSLNRKLKHAQEDGTCPRVTICLVNMGRLTSFAELEEAGLLTPEAPKAAPREVRYTNTRIPDEWPDLSEYMGGAGDRSSPEISWAMAALGKGWPEYAVVDRLKVIGPKAKTRRDKYAENTVARAAQFLASSPDRRASL